METGTPGAHVLVADGDGGAICVVRRRWLYERRQPHVSIYAGDRAVIAGGGRHLLSPGQALRLAPTSRAATGRPHRRADWMTHAAPGHGDVANAVPQRTLYYEKVFGPGRWSPSVLSAITIYLFLGYNDDVERLVLTAARVL